MGLSRHSAADAAHLMSSTAKSLNELSISARRGHEESRGRGSGRGARRSRVSSSLSSSRSRSRSRSRSTESASRSAKSTSKKSAKPKTGVEKENGITDSRINLGIQNLDMFVKGASPAQLAQIDMIRRVFERMDFDQDGLLSSADVRAYFRSIGRQATDPIIRNWIQARDVDQDGAVSLPEFVSSFSLQLDPTRSISNQTSRVEENISDLVNSSGVTTAFGLVSMCSTVHETLTALSAIEEIVSRIVVSPTTAAFWRIKVNDAMFLQKIGRLVGGVKLMQAMGFELEANGEVLALRDPEGKIWTEVPLPLRQRLSHRLKELLAHRQTLLEPTISNIAAGN